MKGAQQATALQKRVVEVFEGRLRSIRLSHKITFQGTKWASEDCCADVKVKVEDDGVLVTYDGVGYDFFTPVSEFNISERHRNLIRDDLATIDGDLYFEDLNNWSMKVYCR